MLQGAVKVSVHVPQNLSMTDIFVLKILYVSHPCFLGQFAQADLVGHK
jgi:hypothetical protein